MLGYWRRKKENVPLEWCAICTASEASQHQLPAVGLGSTFGTAMPEKFAPNKKNSPFHQHGNIEDLDLLKSQ